MGQGREPQAREGSVAERSTSPVALLLARLIGIRSFRLFACLQLLDFLTTVFVLQHGGFEANPVVGHLMVLGPLNGLLTAKLTVITMGAFIALWDYRKVLPLANSLYSAVICWNLVAMFVIHR